MLVPRLRKLGRQLTAATVVSLYSVQKQGFTAEKLGAKLSRLPAQSSSPW